MTPKSWQIQFFRSFRFRLILLLVVPAALALLLFSAVTWWYVFAAGRDRLDSVLTTEIMPAASTVAASDEGAWAAFDQLLRTRFDGAPGAIPADRPPRVVLLVRDGNGGIVYRSDAWPDGLVADVAAGPKARRPPPPFGPPPPRRKDEPGGEFERGNAVFARPPQAARLGPPPAVALSQRSAFGHDWVLAQSPFQGLGVTVAVDVGVVHAELGLIADRFIATGAGVLTLLAVAAWFVSDWALRPVRRLAVAAQGITARGLDQRLATGRETPEIEALITVFNAMLERLEKSFLQASRFSADAAHELKTPLTILQGEIERALHRAPAADQPVLAGLLDEVRRLSAICRRLLLLSLADAGRLALHVEPVNLNEMLDELMEDVEAEAPSLALETAVDSGLIVQGDAALLRQAMQNLVSNAVKYNLPLGWIGVSARRDDNQVVLIISNAGAVIAAEDRGRIFERFYRGDRAHGRRVDGIGLGLSLAREIFRAHGGDLVLEDTDPGEVRFRATLPRSLGENV